MVFIYEKNNKTKERTREGNIFSESILRELSQKRSLDKYRLLYKYWYISIDSS